MHSKLRVLHSCLIWLPITQKWMYNMITHLPEMIHNTIVCAKKENINSFSYKNLYSKKEDYFRFSIEEGLRRTGLLNSSFLLKKKLKETNSQILHSHFGDQAWEDSNIEKNPSYKHIAHFYGYDVNMLIQEDEKWKDRYHQLFDRVDRVLCEGSFMAKSIEALGCDEKKIMVYHLGVEVEKLPFKPRVWEKDSVLKVLIAGSFREKKGIPYALEALGKIKNEVKLEINIIGDAGNKEKHQREKKNILAVVKKHDLADLITWHGFVDHDRLIYEAMNNHIFISPSVTAADGDSEGGCPVTIIELSATGMPVISTNHCDIPEVVLDGKTGYLSSERDISGLVDNLLKLLDHSDQWDKMADQARSHIKENYNIEKQGEVLSQIYHNCLSSDIHS